MFLMILSYSMFLCFPMITWTGQRPRTCDVKVLGSIPDTRRPIASQTPLTSLPHPAQNRFQRLRRRQRSSSRRRRRQKTSSASSTSFNVRSRRVRPK